MRVFNLPYRELSSDEVEKIASEVGLEVVLDGTLTKYPGSGHWHFQKDKKSGRLELTCWPMTSRLWLSVQGGREAPWIDDAVAAMQAALSR